MPYVHEWVDSFDRYGASGVAADMTLEAYSDVAGFNDFASGRTGRCLRLFHNGTNAYIEKIFNAPSPTRPFGFAFRMSNLSSLSNIRILELYDGSTLHAYLRISPTTLKVFNGDGTEIATASVTFSNNVFYHIEGLITIDDSAGVATIKVDGVTKINATSLDSRNGGAAQATKLRLGDSAAGGSATISSWDDLVIQGPTGAFIGPVQVDFLLPNGNTGNNEFSTDSGGPGDTNFQHVDEAPANTSDYVESSTPGITDLYSHAGMTLAGRVLAVVSNIRALNTTGGGNQLKHTVKVGATEYASAAQTLLTTYEDRQAAFLPADVGGSLTVAIVNAMYNGPQVA